MNFFLRKSIFQKMVTLSKWRPKLWVPYHQERCNLIMTEISSQCNCRSCQLVWYTFKRNVCTTKYLGLSQIICLLYLFWKKTISPKIYSITQKHCKRIDVHVGGNPQWLCHVTKQIFFFSTTLSLLHSLKCYFSVFVYSLKGCNL